jgi:molybdopterin molybdotransferase
MISFEEAISIVLKSARPLPARSVRVEAAVGRVLLEDVRSGMEMPPFDKAAVDGYAVRAADLAARRELKLAGVVAAGSAFKGRLGRGQCVKIMTGAPVPAGADAVVMVEVTSEAGGLVRFEERVKKGANIARRAEDIRKGQKILPRGTVLAVSHIAALAAVGRGSVKAGALPAVALINTGGEIVAPGARLGRNQIYNSNGPMLAALLKTDGINAEPVIARDDARALKAAVSKALKADIVLISGGVSMGDYDLVPAVLKSLGVRCLFHKVRVRPGKPMFFGVKGRKLVFGIPGNPVANFMAYLAYIRPAIRKLASRADYAPEFKTGACAAPFDPRTPRRALVLSTVRAATRYAVAGVANNGSADILALARANGLVMVKENGRLKKGAKAGFLTWL